MNEFIAEEFIAVYWCRLTRKIVKMKITSNYRFEFYYRYQENARALSRAYRDRPASPLETAVWWSEFIARGNGRRYLRSEGADLPWYQYYLFDVFLFLAVILLTAFYVTYRLMKFLLFLCCSRKSCNTTERSPDNGKKTKRKNE